MNRLTFIVLSIILLVFTACEPKTKYIKKTYINETAIVEGKSDPMRNITWLANIQDGYDADNSRYEYKALLLFKADGDNDEHILEYSAYSSFGKRNEVILRNLDSSIYEVENGEYPPTAYSSLSESTYSMIRGLINSKLDNNASSGVSTLNTRANAESAPPPRTIIPEIDTILNGATGIEILSCYRLVKEMK